MRADAMESALLQALVVRAEEGLAAASIRQLAKATGLSRQKVAVVTDRLVSTGQISVVQRTDGKCPVIWRITGPRSTGNNVAHNVAHTVAHSAEGQSGNAIPTMPFQLLPPSGVGSSWFETVYRQLTRNLADAASGRISALCRKCADTGYFLEKVSDEYSRNWLKTCGCEAGQWKVIPEDPDYDLASEPGVCLMCGNSGWVMVGSFAQRCYSCGRTLA